MLLSPENGLVLYERVISVKAEHQLLDKLSKPKFYHGTPTAAKRHPGHPRTMAQQPQQQPHGSGPSTSSPEPRPGSPGGRHSPDTHTGSEGHGEAGAGGGRGQGPQHRVRSASTGPGRAGGAGGGGGGAGSREGGGGGAGPAVSHPVRRKPLYPEDGPLKEYFGKERASVTATTVFTWGNRYKIGSSGSGRVAGAGAGGGGTGNGVAEPSTFKSYTPAQHKPPLRL